MRILVLGAGALGGIFGGRLAQAGADITFLVRPARAAQLAEHGLVIESPFGNATIPVRTTQAATPGYDLVVLTCKAYDLPGAIAAIAPAVTAQTAILPVLNGLSHIDTLVEAFGPHAVLGGLAKIQATLTKDARIIQLNDWRWLTFGERDGTLSPRVTALSELAASAIGIEVKAVPDITAQMWEKLVHLATAATATVLMRANIGEIVRAGGGPLLQLLLDRNAAIASHHGHTPGEAFMASFRALFADPASAYTASMLRDLEAGARIESNHIIGFMLAAAQRANVPHDLHEIALLHAKAYEQRREANRLPNR
jgi:2-dehydropantoate 2-reductase